MAIAVAGFEDVFAESGIPCRAYGPAPVPAGDGAPPGGRARVRDGLAPPAATAAGRYSPVVPARHSAWASCSCRNGFASTGAPRSASGRPAVP